MTGTKNCRFITGVSILAFAYLLFSSHSLLFKSILLCFTILTSCLAVGDGDLTLLFCENFGSSAKNLRGKVVWITGASSGLGAALAVYLSRYGVKLALSARSVDLLKDVKKKCIDAGAEDDDILILPLDVVKYEQHVPAFQSVINCFKKIDVLVSNAGRSQRASWEEIDTAVDKELFDLNVFSLVALARVVTKHFLNNGGGHHVVTSSTTGKLGPPFSATYAASKHALHGYFETLRFEKGNDGINITMLCPGPFSSNLIAGCFTDKLGKKVEQERKGEMMTAERCAELSAVAIANKLSEVWIAEQPRLMFYYINQYFPSFFKLACSMVSKEYIMKLRDGHNKAVKQ